MADLVRILLRVPRDLHEELRVWAAEEERSLTNLIVWLLRRALREKKDV